MDTDLVIRAQQGDQAAFAGLAAAVYGRLQQVSFRVLRDRQLAQDATQQATLSMWRNLPQLKDPARFEPWSYRICLNACYNEARRRGRTLPEIGPRAYREPAVAGGYEAVVDRDELERGFRRLSLEHRTVLVLHHYLGMSLEQVAETMDIPLGTVKSRLNRALANMRRALEADASVRVSLPQRREAIR